MSPFHHPDGLPNFDVICHRLRLALELKSDTELAAKLGLSPQALYNRRKRNAVPAMELDYLIEKTGLNPAWVYGGEQPVFSERALQQRQAELRDALSEIEAMSRFIESRASAPREKRELLRTRDADEVRLLKAWRDGGEEVRAALRALLDGKPLPARVTIHGDVGQQVHGDQHVNSPMTITTGGKRR